MQTIFYLILGVETFWFIVLNIVLIWYNKKDKFKKEHNYLKEITEIILHFYVYPFMYLRLFFKNHERMFQIVEPENSRNIVYLIKNNNIYKFTYIGIEKLSFKIKNHRIFFMKCFLFEKTDDENQDLISIVSPINITHSILFIIFKLRYNYINKIMKKEDILNENDNLDGDILLEKIKKKKRMGKIKYIKNK